MERISHKQEIEVDGRELSVYYEIETDYSSFDETKCTRCGKNTFYFARSAVILHEVFDARRMIQLENKKLFKKVKKILEQDHITSYHSNIMCEDCEELDWRLRTIS